MRLFTRLGPTATARITRTMLSAIDEVSANRWEAAKARAAALPGDLRPDKIKALTAAFSRELGAAGAAAGAAAAAPAVGTTATLVATLAELAWFTGRAGDLVLTMAALHGRSDPTVDERRAWVLAVLIYGSSARDELSRALNSASTGVTVAADDRIPVATIQATNRLMSRALARRYGTRRGLAALGRLIPIGIGAAIGGTTNYLTIRHLADHADRFFTRLPYSAIDTRSTDITDHQLSS
ncbi:MAG: hypothetical protein CSA55_02610 [Ilumatobacter coccineus]|uniref:EcsC family protein n=1 Tax=Ilumatobacter coccineus TaxID=467094 RepID=A0A2G6KB98_9ACTN|nr:MAG: hypothetical protein CSA55_02610 [Ilumatobacter coccineus]